MQNELTSEEAALLPVKARLLANGLFFPRGEQAMLLRDMADEIERILAASRYSADLCTQALADIKRKDAEIAALKAGLEAERDRRFEGNRISSEEHAAEVAALRQALRTILQFNDSEMGDGARKVARQALAQAVQPARVVRAAVGKSKPLTAEQYASIRQPLP